MTPSKILAVKLRALGDTVLMTAPVIELTRVFPQAEIDILVMDPWAPIMKGIPGVHRIWTLPQTSGKVARLRALTRLARNLRKEKYDWAINFHASPSSSQLCFATGTKNRSIHFHGHSDANRYSTVTIPGKGTLKPIIERDMDTIRALGVHVPAGRMPHIFLHPTEIEEAVRYFNKLGMKGPILGLSLGASRPTKTWPIERFASLALEWCQVKSGAVLVIAGPTEEHLIHQFLKSLDDLLGATLQDAQARSQIRSRVATAHQLNLRTLTAILSQVSVLAGNDSGPKHLAVAVDTPTVTLFGPEDPFEWHPYPQERHVYSFISDLPCRKDADPGMLPWCGIHECVVEEHKCMRLIGVDSVFKSCEKVAKTG